MTVMAISYQTLVQDQLSEVEQRMRAQAEGNHPDLASALEHVIAAGGKRVRPTITLLSGGLFGADTDRLMNLAAAIELLHTATLVHDDLIDGALLRRGMSTLNASWSPAATVLTGDFVFARAAKLAAETDSVAVMHLFAETLTIIVNGEINQLFHSKGIASREDYYHRIYAKTASMFELATGAAAMLSPVDESIVTATRRFGYEIGMAFQIVDDILDFTGDQANVGKPVASDLRQGLITLPALYYLESHPEDKDLRWMLNGGYNEKRVDQLVAAIRKSDAIPQAMKEARSFAQRALDILEDLPVGPERQALAELTQYIVRRKV